MEGLKSGGCFLGSGVEQWWLSKRLPLVLVFPLKEEAWKAKSSVFYELSQVKWFSKDAELAQVVLRSHIGVRSSFELGWKLVWMPLLEIVWRARPWETRLKVNVRMLCLWWCLVLRIRMQSEMVPLVGKKCLIYLHLNLPSSLKHLEKLFAFVGHFCLNWLFAFVGLNAFTLLVKCLV